MSNIKLNHVNNIDLLLLNDKYYDFILSDDNNCGTGLYNNNCIISEIDLNDNNCIIDGELYSNTKYNWSEAINDNVILNNIGLTGVDNGLIHYRKDEICNIDFLNLLTNTQLKLTPNDYRLHLKPIISNTLFYDYPYVMNDNYITFMGGFFQGFFKLFNNNYQVIPHQLINTWEFNFKLRPCDYTLTSHNIVNQTYPNNKGIFFYIGTRAENKFWLNYNTIDQLQYFDKRGCDLDSDDDFIASLDNVILNDYIKCDVDDSWVTSDEQNSCEQLSWVDNTENDNIEWIYTEDDKCYITEDYIGKQEDITQHEVITHSGYDINTSHITEITTDNKFLLFNRTNNGYTIDTWKEGETLTYTQAKQASHLNYFLLFNRSKDGYTIDTIDSFLSKTENKKRYDVINDISNNAFCLKINDDGSIGYKYLIRDCESGGYSIFEEYSNPNIISKCEWSDISVKITNITNNSGCYNSNDLMRIYIYVNEFLIFISDDLPIFNFKELNDIDERQESVAYNISIGGGTQGLLETIWLNYYKLPEYILPIEKHFCGSFIGDVSYFNIKIENEC